MTRLVAKDRQELLADAGSDRRRQDFARVDCRLVVMSPADYMAFLTSVSELATHAPRKPIKGDRFLL